MLEVPLVVMKPMADDGTWEKENCLIWSFSYVGLPDMGAEEPDGQCLQLLFNLSRLTINVINFVSHRSPSHTLSLGTILSNNR